MPKKDMFKNSNSTKAFKEVGAEYAEKGNVISLINVNTENLVDHPDNGEDITMTADLENSINEFGFIDPIEITSHGMDEGMYMIVSGRRRRAAGVKLGMTSFPCLLRNFESSLDVSKYVLYANQHRNSDNDPLLYARRYKMHQAQLTAEGFKGSKRMEIAKRMGLSPAQADRYEALNSIIESVWIMITEGKIGVSSVHKMAAHSADEQNEIVVMFNQCLSTGKKLTRETADMIIEAYRKGARKFADCEVRDSGLPLSGSMNTEPTETKESINDRRNENKRENDPIAAEYDGMDKDKSDWENENTDKKPPLSDDEKVAKKESDNAKTLLLLMEKIDTITSDIYTFDNDEDAEAALMSMGSTVVSLINAIHAVSTEYGKDKAYKETLSKVNKMLKMYLKQ